MLVVLKLGGSVITDKHSRTPRVDSKNLKRLARETARAYARRRMRLVLIHGAGSYGHQIVKRTGIREGVKDDGQRLAFAETQRLQNELNTIFTKALIGEGVPAIPCQASASAVMDSGRLVSLDCSAIKGFLQAGLVPVLYGVPAYDRRQNCSILSGDQIAPYLAVKLGANRIIHGTNVDGVFTADPNTTPDAALIKKISSHNFEQVISRLAGSTAVDVTGGMLGKVSELLSLAKKGTESQIVNALRPGVVERALLGDSTIGTVIRWKKKK